MILEPRVIQIERGIAADRMLIGGKASSLVTLLGLGASVPPAFVLTTASYRDWATHPDPTALNEVIGQGILGLEARTGRKLGAGAEGLIVSVRSGAPVSMPGMMDTVLNVGIGPLAAGAQSFVYDARARFLWQFAELVLELDREWLKSLQAEYAGPIDHLRLETLEGALRTRAESKGGHWPTSPEEELAGAVTAVFASWQSKRAKLYRRMQKISDALGTSVTIQQMVFGNRDTESGSGVAFTRNPTTGEAGLSGEFLTRGQGEEVVSGRETASALMNWRTRQPTQYAELDALGSKLEAATGKVHEIEFTVESGRFYVLQCRPALLTARGAARVAVEMHREGRLSKADAIAYAMKNGFDPTAAAQTLCVRPDAAKLAVGLPVGGGVAVGRVAMSDTKMEEIIKAGDPVVFMTLETSPNLLPLMQRSAALVTMRGGATSHAAVVARELGTPCVVGVGGEIGGGRALVGGTIDDGAWITVDGDTGSLYLGDVSTSGLRLSAEESTLREWAQNSAGQPSNNAPSLNLATEAK